MREKLLLQTVIKLTEQKKNDSLTNAIAKLFSVKSALLLLPCASPI